MANFLEYLQVFAVGGLICLMGQLLINYTKMTSSRILVIFLLLGCLLEALGIFDAIESFAGCGITIPIVGFGSTLVKGSIAAMHEYGLLGVLTGGMIAGAAGLAAAILFGFVMAVLFKARTKS